MKHAGHCIPLGGDCVICDDRPEGLKIAELRAALKEEQLVTGSYKETVKELRRRLEQHALRIDSLLEDLAAKDRVLERTRKERDDAVLQLAEAKRPLLPRGGR